mgnify:CR=1 FL=1
MGDCLVYVFLHQTQNRKPSQICDISQQGRDKCKSNARLLLPIQYYMIKSYFLQKHGGPID